MLGAGALAEEMLTLDVRGEASSYVSSLARLAMNGLAVGESLRLVTDLPTVVDDLNRVFGLLGDEVRRVEAAEEGWVVTIRKRFCAGRHTCTVESNGHLPPGIRQDVEEFQNNLLAYFRGEMDPAAFRQFRLLRGVYGQRQPGLQMVRVKLPFGRLTSAQLRVCGYVAQEFGNGTGHITTRQDLQFHFIPLPRVPAFLRTVGAAGLTTREACGSTVRNVTACPLAGVCPRETFDVTPYAAAVSGYFLRHPLVQALPRKFKIAFSGCPDDCSLGSINDIGLVAVQASEEMTGDLQPSDGDGQQTGVHTQVPAPGPTQLGFRIVVGGGLGASPEIAHLLGDFVPVEQLIPTCEAIVRVFDREGNRKNRNAARLKFVIRRLGMARFRQEVEKERASLPERVPIDDTLFREEPPTVPDAPPVAPYDAGKYQRWRRQNVAPQRQQGFALVTLWLPRGDVTSEQFASLAVIADLFSDGTVRTTVQQDIVLRWIRQEHLPALFNALDRVGLAEPIAQSMTDIVSCPGADTCRLGITRSRGVVQALTEALHNERDAEDLAGTRIKASGCPNACGQHWIATIGLQGAALKAAEGRRMPAYQLLLGGSAGAAGTRVGRPVARLPARRVPEAVRRLIALYRSEKQASEDFPAFAARLEVGRVRQLLADLQTPTPADETEPLFIDFGDTHEFRIETGEGECAS